MSRHEAAANGSDASGAAVALQPWESDTGFGERVLRTVTAHFNTVAARHYRLQPREWCMLGSIVATRCCAPPGVSGTVERDGSRKEGDDDLGVGSKYSMEVVTMATGTKCLGRDALRGSAGRLLRDVHAEVLARRGLKVYVRMCVACVACVVLTCVWHGHACRLLLAEMKRMVVDAAYVSRWIERVRDAGSSARQPPFRIRRGVDFHLFISDTPCGDASLVQVDTPCPATISCPKPAPCVGSSGGASGSGDSGGSAPATTSTSAPAAGSASSAAAVAASEAVQAAARAGAGGSRWTGAKPVGRWSRAEVQGKRDAQFVGVLRTKSGRSDLSLGQRSNSMCCSDKIARCGVCQVV